MPTSVCSVESFCEVATCRALAGTVSSAPVMMNAMALTNKRPCGNECREENCNFGEPLSERRRSEASHTLLERSISNSRDMHTSRQPVHRGKVDADADTRTARHIDLAVVHANLFLQNAFVEPAIVGSDLCRVFAEAGQRAEAKVRGTSYARFEHSPDHGRDVSPQTLVVQCLRGEITTEQTRLQHEGIATNDVENIQGAVVRHN
jgi:hypothetical protein